MSADNNWILTGNLTRDPEVKQIGENKVAKFGVAYNKVFKKDGEKKEQTSFFNVEVWGRQAEIAEEYLKKGDLVSLQGEAVQDTWEKDGEKRSQVYLKVTDLRLRGKKAKVEVESETTEGTSQDIVPF